MNKSQEQPVSFESSKSSKALLLITFMVAELVVASDEMPFPPGVRYKDHLDKDQFLRLQKNMLTKILDGRTAHLNMADCLYLYLLVDLVCRCFVSGEDEVIRSLAKKNLDIKEEDYKGIRRGYLKFGASFLSRLNEVYANNDEFIKMKDLL